MPEIGKWEAASRLTVLTGDITTADNQNLELVPDGTGIVQIGDAGTTNHGLNANDDLFVSGRLEVDERVWIDGATWFGNTVEFATNVPFFLGAGGQGRLVWSSFQTNDSLMMGTTCGSPTASGNIIICNSLDVHTDFGHPVASNPTLYIQSVDATSPSEHLKFLVGYSLLLRHSTLQVLIIHVLPMMELGDRYVRMRALCR